MMRIFNTKKPSIEPRATQHIIEQIEMVQQILDNGYGYIANGSVYFDTLKFNEEQKCYGKLSGRIIEDLISESRDNLKNQSDKKHPSDFAIWMKASPDHLMKWNSPWSEGFPGWHLECSVMSTKYLGDTFDIHGGGNDLKFPHHENEVAQNVGACGCQPCNYWLHTNMLLMNGKKMSKSDGNTITPEQLFTGDSPHITKAYSPMVIKFFMLQSHYSSTNDLTNEGLLAAEKGYKRIVEAQKILKGLTTKGTSDTLDKDINAALDQFMTDMCDDFNTPRAMASIFELVKAINSFKEGHLDIHKVSQATLQRLQETLPAYLSEILGLETEATGGGDAGAIDAVMQMVLELRQDARAEKNWAVADKIRDGLAEAKIVVKDGKDGSTWSAQ